MSPTPAAGQSPTTSKRRAGMVAVHSVNRFVTSVPDLGEAQRFYGAFGLDVRSSPQHLDLHTFGHPHCWAQVFKNDGLRKQLAYISFGIFADDEDEFRQRIIARNIGIAAHPLSDGQGLWLSDPDGTAVQLIVASKVSPSAPSPATPLPLVPPGAGAAPSRSRVDPVRPRYLSHILLFSPDVPRMVAFCESFLGLRLSDGSADLIAFAHTPHGSDHHLVAFAKSHATGLHHSSWDVPSVDDVGRGMEQMRTAGWADGWGVGRHVLGSNFFNYVQDPWGSFCEYSAGIDYIPATLDWVAADHPPEDSFYLWGPPVPANFVINTEHPEPEGAPT
jgi:catechol 2,3-dioxygenase-like lactoylglutathione lyase family enzyme